MISCVINIDSQPLAAVQGGWSTQAC